jgi:hypothetical protein
VAFVVANSLDNIGYLRRLYQESQGVSSGKNTDRWEERGQPNAIATPENVALYPSRNALETVLVVYYNQDFKK